MADYFDLRTLVREVLDTSIAADPATLAKEVGLRISRRDRDAALEQALPTYVHHVITRNRHSASPGGQASSVLHRAVAAGGAHSPRVAGIREAWRRTLMDRLPVSEAPHDWKRLGDCTAIDLDYAARIREQQAAACSNRAAQYRRIADLLTTYDVVTVRELPDAVLASEFGGER